MRRAFFAAQHRSMLKQVLGYHTLFARLTTKNRNDDKEQWQQVAALCDRAVRRGYGREDAQT